MKGSHYEVGQTVHFWNDIKMDVDSAAIVRMEYHQADVWSTREGFICYLSETKLGFKYQSAFEEDLFETPECALKAELREAKKDLKYAKEAYDNAQDFVNRILSIMEKNKK